MDKWFAIPDSTKRNAYIQIAEKTGMAPFAVEKDWWVVQALTVIFEMEIANHLVFKGGTSLSKAWNLIERFSEDIDLAIDRRFFGFEGALSKRQIEKLRAASNDYMVNVFYPELQKRFQEKGITKINWDIEKTDNAEEDPVKIYLYYPEVIESPGYLEPRIQIEISCRSLREPFTTKTFRSLIDEEYPEMEFAQQHIEVQTVNPERTFLEKIFLLHEEFHRPIDKIRVTRLSRHLYDIYHLSNTEYAEKAINDKELYETIVVHRHKFTRVGGVNYNEHNPQAINPIPIPEVIETWKEDYKIMLEQMIYEENKPSFEDIIYKLTELKEKINVLNWKLETEFPVPNN
ncbi:nucleotidyl transferase AbiEii/AbiGii toxin family protein [Flavobacterium sp.]|uniref:nucleotidyl transferase AbiEii/AbiGii toxin family protein n=1 Tax=Flavobacterium sp. TaxID=239 RepID=UPI00260CF686|nr:nucleotidyl transferase AbiEii/AbiGii toxin family protein [Flavobacterium sp.]